MNMDDVESFIKLNIVSLSRDVITWKDTAKIPDTALIYDAVQYCVQVGIPSAHTVVEALISYHAMKFVVETGASTS